MAPTATGTSSTTAAPSSTSAPNAASTSASMPGSLEEATQRYHSTKLAVRTGLANKRIIDRSLIDLESQIYLFEGSYLQSTSSSGGNIVKGFDAYLKNSASGSSRGNTLAAEVPVEDRIFSLSSATYQKSLELKANEAFGEQEESSANNTPKGKTGDESTPTGKKKKDTASSGTPAGKDGGLVLKKKNKEGEGKKEKERSSTPNLKSTGGKNSTEGGSAGGTPTKSGGGKAVAGGTGTKLKRKNTDGAGTPGGKAVKRKKDDD